MQITIYKRTEKMAKKRKNSNYVGSKSYYKREAAMREKEAALRRHKCVVIVSLVLALVILISIPFATVGIVRTYKTSRMGTGHADETLVSRDVSKRKVHYAEFTIENYGKFVVLLDETAAPKTVANFVKLVNEGFYDGLTFHRAKDSFIQGGDPNGDGTGGSAETIKGEFYSNNGYVNSISHKRGAISMARSGANVYGEDGKTIIKKAYDTASSQFFICTKDCSSSFDKNYATFGYVVEGMSVVDDVNAAMLRKLGEGEETIEKVSKQPVIKSVKILEDYTFTHEH